MERARRLRYARDILARDLLPHVGTDVSNRTLKGYFLGYMVHRLMSCSLGRADEDDRDHFGNKRLDLSGARERAECLHERVGVLRAYMQEHFWAACLDSFFTTSRKTCARFCRSRLTRGASRTSLCLSSIGPSRVACDMR